MVSRIRQPSGLGVFWSVCRVQGQWIGGTGWGLGLEGDVRCAFAFCQCDLPEHASISRCTC